MIIAPGYCHATIYKRDQYRRARVGNHMGFRMHYTEDTCSRKAKYGKYCWQHKWKAKHDNLVLK